MIINTKICKMYISNCILYTYILHKIQKYTKTYWLKVKIVIYIINSKMCNIDRQIVECIFLIIHYMCYMYIPQKIGKIYQIV